MEDRSTSNLCDAWLKSLFLAASRRLPFAHFKLHCYFFAFYKFASFAYTIFDWHEIAAIFRKQRCQPLLLANSYANWDYSPTVCHKLRYCLDIVALLLRD